MEDEVGETYTGNARLEKFRVWISGIWGLRGECFWLLFPYIGQGGLADIPGLEQKNFRVGCRFYAHEGAMIALREIAGALGRSGRLELKIDCSVIRTFNGIYLVGG